MPVGTLMRAQRSTVLNQPIYDLTKLDKGNNKVQKDWQPLWKNINYGLNDSDNPGSNHSSKFPDASGMLQAATNHGERTRTDRRHGTEPTN